MIVAVEGVSCTGKTTLAAELCRALGWGSVGCYYHVADDPAVLGEPLPTSETDQLEALAAHFVVEQHRARHAAALRGRDGGVIVDRSVDTLLAHLGAAGRIQGLNCDKHARVAVDRQVTAGAAMLPDLTLLLIAPPDVLAARARTRPKMPAVYYDPVYARHFNAHFSRAVSPHVVVLDATQSPAEVADAALAYIRGR
ncbi:AAA family ATPase [Planotetraspora sp. GP83]|uniref:AAA family ATPase n=1 Tax=Planotetraspora sp. GP83 TaxID=3156264 RepID=UPI003513711F